MTSGSAFLSVTCSETREEIIVGTESLTSWNVCRVQLDSGIRVKYEARFHLPLLFSALTANDLHIHVQGRRLTKQVWPLCSVKC